MYFSLKSGWEIPSRFFFVVIFVVVFSFINKNFFYLTCLAKYILYGPCAIKNHPIKHTEISGNSAVQKSLKISGFHNSSFPPEARTIWNLSKIMIKKNHRSKLLSIKKSPWNLIAFFQAILKIIIPETVLQFNS